MSNPFVLPGDKLLQENDGGHLLPSSHAQQGCVCMGKMGGIAGSQTSARPSAFENVWTPLQPDPGH